jgi:hypothetical protein
MTFENLDVNGNLQSPEAPPPEESGNRMFFIVAGVLGGIALLALICIAVYALVWRPQSMKVREQNLATLNAQNTEVASIIASTSTAARQAAIEAAYTATSTKTPVPAPPTATLPPTSVVAIPSEGSPAAATLLPEMATATALYPTLTANAILFSQTLTARPALATSTVIPDTGFADNIGLPLMLGLAVLLIVVIFLARRLRTT